MQEVTKITFLVKMAEHVTSVLSLLNFIFPGISAILMLKYQRKEDEIKSNWKPSLQNKLVSVLRKYIKLTVIIANFSEYVTKNIQNRHFKRHQRAAERALMKLVLKQE